MTWDARWLFGDASVQAAGAAVSGNFFDVLGARPLIGRTFRHEDDVAGARPVLVLSHDAWTTHFGADRGVIGRTMAVREKVDVLRFEIVGVMPADFFYPSGAKYWTPAAATVARMSGNDEEAVGLTLNELGVFHGVARLAPGVELDSARDASRRTWQSIVESEKGGDPSKVSVALTPLVDHVFGRARPMLRILLAAVLTVLLAACANVSGLLVARGATRQREFAVLAALGAGRSRLLGQLAIEGSVLATAGAGLGLTLAILALRYLPAVSPAEIPRLAGVAIDTRVLTFAIAATVLTALVLTLFPAWHLERWSISSTLQAANKGTVTGGTRAGLRRALVVAQVAMGVVLLIATGLTIQSFVRLSALDLGFNPTNVVTFGLDGLDEARYPSRPTRHDVVNRLIERFERIPNVERAAGVLLRPFGAGAIGWDAAVLIEGQTMEANDWAKNPIITFEAATPGYFAAMGIRLVSGRDFGTADRADTPPVAIVSENLAARLWPGQNPIGKRVVDTFSVGGPRPTQIRWHTVVGVVPPVFYREIDRARFDYYIPLAQAKDFDVSHMLVRTSSEPQALVPTLNREAAALDPGLSLAEPTTMSAIVGRARGPWQFTMLVFVAFGVVSVALTAVGIVGLVSYTVAERRHEVGVRMALGAEARQVVAMFLVQAGKLVALGLAVGAGIAFLTTRLLGAMLFGVSPTDLATFAGASLLLAAVALVACYVPSRRAAAVDPSIVFRDGSG